MRTATIDQSCPEDIRSTLNNAAEGAPVSIRPLLRGSSNEAQLDEIQAREAQGWQDGFLAGVRAGTTTTGKSMAGYKGKILSFGG